jgi:hypothetical protein
VLTANLAFSKSWGSYNNFKLQVYTAVQCPPGSSPGKNGRSVVSIIWVPGSEKTPERLLSAGLHREITEWDVQTLEPIEILVQPRWNGRAPDWWEKLQATGHHFCSIKDGDVLKCFP